MYIHLKCQKIILIKADWKVSVVNEENVPIKGAAVRLSYTGNPDNIIGESGYRRRRDKYI